MNRQTVSTKTKYLLMWVTSGDEVQETNGVTPSGVIVTNPFMKGDLERTETEIEFFTLTQSYQLS